MFAKTAPCESVKIGLCVKTCLCVKAAFDKEKLLHVKIVFCLKAALCVKVARCKDYSVQRLLRVKATLSQVWSSVHDFVLHDPGIPISP